MQNIWDNNYVGYRHIQSLYWFLTTITELRDKFRYVWNLSSKFGVSSSNFLINIFFKNSIVALGPSKCCWTSLDDSPVNWSDTTLYCIYIWHVSIGSVYRLNHISHARLLWWKIQVWYIYKIKYTNLTGFFRFSLFVFFASEKCIEWNAYDSVVVFSQCTI